MKENSISFRKGLKDGLPIALGYFAVAFSLGIVAKKAGLDPLQGFISSFLNHASAGEYAQFTVILSDAAYLEMAIVIFITNIRYLLMSCSLSQRLAPNTPLRHRLLVGFSITDEIFGISIAQKGKLNPYYPYGAAAIALPLWSTGTAMGIMAGNILPPSVVSALSVALYGMFLAIIIPPAKKSKVVFAVVAVSFTLSFAMANINLFSRLSESMRIVILTVVISAAAAIMFPVKDETNQDNSEECADES